MRRLLLVVLCIVASCRCQDVEASGEQEDGGIRRSRKRPVTAASAVDRLFIFYNRNELPHSHTATNVSFTLAIDDIYSLSVLTQDLSLSYHLEMAWIDPRLKLDQDFGDIRLGEGRWHEIWVPDAILANEKRSAAHSLTVANRLLTLGKGGQLSYTLRLSSSLACPMSSVKFPFDSPTCQVVIKSLGHSPAAVAFSWSGVTVADRLSLADYSLTDHSNNTCQQHSGAVSCLSVSLHFKRKWAPYFIKFYVPSLVMVLLSWTQVQVESARASLLVGLFCALGLLHLLVSAPCQATLLDGWLLACLLLVSLQLAVLALTHRQQEQVLPSKEKGDERRPLKLVLKIIFPALFVLFNIIYWGVVIAA